MWWEKSESPEKSRLEQLLEARDKVKRHLETLRMVPPPPSPAYVTDIPREIAELSNVLEQIENELADEQSEKPS